MATMQDVVTALDGLKATAQAEREQVLAALGEMQTQITALLDQIAQGTEVTAADLDGFLTQIADVKTAIEGIQA